MKQGRTNAIYVTRTVRHACKLEPVTHVRVIIELYLVAPAFLVIKRLPE